MPISFTPSPVTNPGEMVTAHVKYNGPGAVPHDVHIDAQQPDGSWNAVTGYDHIPPGMNPAAGFDIPFSSGNPHVRGTGTHKLRVRWTNDQHETTLIEEAELMIWPKAGTVRRTCLGMLSPGWDCTKILKAI